VAYLTINQSSSRSARCPNDESVEKNQQQLDSCAQW